MIKDKNEVVQAINDCFSGVIKKSLSVTDGTVYDKFFENKNNAIDDIAEVIISNFSPNEIDGHVEYFYQYVNNDLIDKRNVENLTDDDIKIMANEVYKKFYNVIDGAFTAASEDVHNYKGALLEYFGNYIKAEKDNYIENKNTASIGMKL